MKAKIKHFILLLQEDKEKQRLLFLVLLFLVSSLFNGRFLFLKNFSNTDEFPSLSVAAFLAGHDWSDLVSKLNFHGYGFSALFVPIFAILDDGVQIYKILLLGILILRILMDILIYKMSYKYFGMPYFISFVIAVICDIGTLAPDDGVALSIMSEVPLTFIMVLALYCFFVGYNSQGVRKVMSYSVCGMVLGYSYIIHSRSVVIWAVVMMTVFLFKLVYKEWDNKIFVVLFSLCLTILLLFVVDSIIQSEVWKNVGVNELDNSTATIASVKITGNLKKFFSFELVRLSISTFVSLLATLSVYTVGTIWILITVCVSALWKIVREKKDSNKPLFVIIVLGLVGFLGMNYSISISSTGAIMAENLRWLTYIRYGKPFAAILIVAASVCLAKKIYNKKFVIISSGIGIVLCLTVFCTKTLQKIEYSQYGLSYSILNRVCYEPNESARHYFYKMSLVTLIVFTIILVLFFRDKIKYCIVIYMGFSVLVTFQQFDFFMKRDELLTNEVNASTELIEKDVLKEFKICYGADNMKFAQYLRWGAYSAEIQYINQLQEFNKFKEVYVTSNVAENEIIQANYVFQLDSNEYLLTSNVQVADILDELFDVVN